MQDLNLKRPSRGRHLAIHACALAALLATSVAGASTLTPAISGTPATGITAGHYYAFTPKASGPAGYPLSFSITGKPAWAGFNRLSGQLLGTPGSANVGKYSNIVIRVSDGVASASLAPFAITVAAASKLAPTISGTPVTGAIVGTRYAFTPKASGPTGYPLTFSISGKPAWASFSTTSGQLAGTPATANIGKYSNIVITVRDSAASVALPPFTISVGAVSSAAPKISGTPAASIAAGNYYAFTPKASGPTGYPLSFSITGKPAWAGFNRLSGQLLGTPTAANVGKYSNIIIRVSDGVKSASLAPFAISVTTTASSGGGPTISGTPPTAVAVGTAYAFTPKATVPSGDSMSFSVKNKPAWASFSIAKGTISGTPAAANVGTYSGIVISASDGIASASLAPFAITVSQPSTGGTGAGSAVLHWTAPTRNTNGSALTNLAGYHIHYGKSPSSMTTSVTVASAGATSYTVSNLASGTWYFAVNAYTTAGTASSFSNTGSKAIP